MSGAKPIRVVGVGSAQGDDAVAWHVVEEFRKCVPGRAQVETHRAPGGERLLDLLDGKGTLVLVDAIRTGGTAGTVHRLQWPDSRVEALRPGSTHEVSPAEALQLAKALGSLPPAVIIICVEIPEPEPVMGLTPPVAAAVPEAVSAVLRELETLRAAPAVPD